MLTFTCATCGTHLQAPDECAGKLMRCGSHTVRAPESVMVGAPVAHVGSASPPPSEARLRNGRQLARDHTWRAAISEFSEAIRLDAASWEAYLRRGEAYYQVDEHDKAHSDFSKAIDLKPDCAEAYRERAGVRLVEGQLEGAIADASAAIRLNPNDPAPYRFRGCSHLNLKQYAEAIRDLSKSLSLDPKDAGTCRSRGLAYWLTSANEQAIEDFSRSLALDPKNDFVAYCRGRAYFDSNRVREAIPDLERGLRLPLPEYEQTVQAAREWLAKAQRSAQPGTSTLPSQQHRPVVTVPSHQSQPATTRTDKCICIRCGSRYELDDPVEAGYKMQCDNCARVMTVGRFFGKHYAGVLKRSVERPRCPSCGSQNSTCGKKVLIGFTSPDLYLRQCNQCHAVWMGNGWYLESRVG